VTTGNAMDVASTPASSAGRWRGAGAPGAMLAALLLLAAVGPSFSPYEADGIDLAQRRGAPSLAHPFGTDELGRDVLTRVLHGARVSLAIGLLAAAVSALAGTAVGAASGYAGGWTDDLLMRVTDGLLALPRLPLLMTASIVIGPSVPSLVLLVGLAGWMELARLVRAEVRSLRARDFVVAARAAGAAGRRVVAVHLLPSVLPSIAVATTIAVGRAILLESAMSFFGVGVQPPRPSWGNMLYQAQASMATEPWLALFPGLAILATTLAVNRLGEALGHTTGRTGAGA